VSVVTVGFTAFSLLAYALRAAEVEVVDNSYRRRQSNLYGVDNITLASSVDSDG